MLHSLYRVGLFAALFGLLLVPGTTWAQAERPKKVDDELGLFKESAVAEANAVIAQIKKAHHKDLYIETRDKGPEKKGASKWAEERADKLGIDGVYIMVSKEPHHFVVYVGNKTLGNYFTQGDREHLIEILSAKLGKKNNEALQEIVTYTRDAMDRHHAAQAKNAAPAKQPAAAPAPGHHGNELPASMPPWVGWLCMIAVVLFVVWIIFAIIRAMTGGMSGGGGYGYGGGGMGMGGGGGFFTGMLGGLFGSMAGMWLYNNMFGGHASYGQNGAVNWGGGDQGSGGDPYQADTGGTAEGGDWGADADKGGGGDKEGGDWGGDKGGDDAGGGDAGGGGDWGGGGGGDAGGGGGGDWGGGGGGGDFGGGGGDFGGGGGGGDW